MISVVTPSLNQGAFVETAVRSVLHQDVDVEYVICDGGSTDGTTAVLERYASQLAWWCSEPDDGQYDALQKGFAQTKGDIMGWLNADDFLLPGALKIVASVFAQHPEVEWVTGTMAPIANEAGGVFRIAPVTRFSRAAFFRGFNLPAGRWHAGTFIPQESTFWRRSLWERAGGRVETSLRLAGDFELWARFYAQAELYGVQALIGVYRSQPAQKTSTAMAEYLQEAERVLRAAGGRPFGERETRLRRRAQRWLTNNRIWRLPTPVRAALEQRELIFRTPELIWRSGGWTLNTRYFV